MSYVVGEEKAALEDIRKGGDKGIDFLYRRYSVKLKAAIRYQYYSGNEDLARQLCDDTFRYFYETANNFREECSIYTYLYRLARYGFLGNLRDKRHQDSWQSSVDKPVESQDDEELFETPESEKDKMEPSDYHPSSIEDIPDEERDLITELCYERCFKMLLKLIEEAEINASRWRILTAKYWKIWYWKVFGKTSAEIAMESGMKANGIDVFLKEHRERIKKCREILMFVARGIPIEEIARQFNLNCEAIAHCRHLIENNDAIVNCFKDCGYNRELFLKVADTFESRFEGL